MTAEQLLLSALGIAGATIGILWKALIYKDKQLDRVREENQKVILGLLHDSKTLAAEKRGEP